MDFWKGIKLSEPESQIYRAGCQFDIERFGPNTWQTEPGFYDCWQLFYAVILPNGRRHDGRQNDLFDFCGRKGELVTRKVISFRSSEARDDSLMGRRVYGRKMSDAKSSPPIN